MEDLLAKMPDYDEYFEYTCSQGETWDSIAYDAWADDDLTGEYLASWLMEVNPQYLETVMFEGGEVLRIPRFYETELEDDESLPPWERTDDSNFFEV